METKFNSQICTTREQSERLLALGLKKETADMVHSPHYDIHGQIKEYCSPKVLEGDLRQYLIEDDWDFSDYIPAWSLARLIEMVASKWQEYMVFLPDAYDEIISDIEIEIGRGDFPKKYLV